MKLKKSIKEFIIRLQNKEQEIKKLNKELTNKITLVEDLVKKRTRK